MCQELGNSKSSHLVPLSLLLQLKHAELQENDHSLWLDLDYPPKAQVWKASGKAMALSGMTEPLGDSA